MKGSNLFGLLLLISSATFLFVVNAQVDTIQELIAGIQDGTLDTDDIDLSALLAAAGVSPEDIPQDIDLTALLAAAGIPAEDLPENLDLQALLLAAAATGINATEDIDIAAWLVAAGVSPEDIPQDIDLAVLLAAAGIPQDAIPDDVEEQLALLLMLAAVAADTGDSTEQTLPAVPDNIDLSALFNGIQDGAIDLQDLAALLAAVGIDPEDIAGAGNSSDNALVDLLNQLASLPPGLDLNAQTLVSLLVEGASQSAREYVTGLQEAEIVPVGGGYAETPFGTIQEDCYYGLVQYLADIQNRNYTALKMLTSYGDLSVAASGFYTGNFRSLGTFEQCREVPGAQYCVMIQPFIPELGVTLDLGTCWPQECSATDLYTTYKTLLETSELSNTTSPAWFSCVADEEPWTSGAITTLTLLCLFGVLVIFGTFYHVVIDNERSTTETSAPETNKGNHNGNPYEHSIKVNNIYEQDVQDEPANGDVISNGDAVKGHDVIRGYSPDPVDEEKMEDMKVKKDTVKGKKRKDLLYNIMTSFSAIKNTSRIMDCSTPSSPQLGAANGIRVISMFWIILGHCNSFILPTSRLGNPRVVFEKHLAHPTFWGILNAVYAVDTFFYLSGLLLTYLTLKQMTKTNGNLNWGLYYFHRYWRITPLYMMVLAIWATLAVHMGTGPFKKELFVYAEESCRDYWWTNLLYISNLYPFPGKLTDQCMGWGWYLSNDMQFFVISPFILILLNKFWKAGIGSIVVLLLVSFGSSAWVVYYWGLGFGNSGLYNNRTLVSPADPGDDILYGKPYARIPPYLVGMLLGYALYKLRNREIKLNPCVNIFGWLFAAVLAFVIVYGVEGTNGDEQPPQWVSMVYNSLARFGFSLSLGWVTFACVTGNGGYINSFLSWSFWTPLARLTFGAYLIHPVIIFLVLTTKPTMFYWTYVELSVFFIGCVVISYAAAFILSLLIEQPAMNIEKALLGGVGKKQKTK